MNLKTAHTGTARVRRDQAERAFRDLIKKIRAGEAVAATALSARERGALWRSTLMDLKKADEDNNAEELDLSVYEYDDAEEGWPTTYDIAMNATEDEAERLKGKDRKEFTNALVGKVAIDELLEPYLRGAKLAEKTTGERRGLVKRFARWCEKEGLKLPDIDRKAVGRYVTAEIEPMHRRTAKKHMTALRGYWEYLTLRGQVSGAIMSGKAVESPWLGQMLPDTKRRVERGERDNDERPFTVEELQALLYADYPKDKVGEGFQQQIEDALRVSCLSGLRLAEVITLWVKDVHDDLFDVQHGKTVNAPRKVPIHPDLKEIVERRTKDKKPEEWLFHELAKERNAGDAFGKNFNRYRKALEVDDMRPGNRRSLVNFHSCRRWFIQQTEHAGIPETTVAAIVGHAGGRKGQTFGGYNKSGPSEEQRRACVDAVKLPGRP